MGLVPGLILHSVIFLTLFALLLLMDWPRATLLVTKARVIKLSFHVREVCLPCKDRESCRVWLPPELVESRTSRLRLLGQKSKARVQPPYLLAV